MSLVFISPDPVKALGLEDFISNYHVVCTFKHPILEFLKKKKIEVFCLEKFLEQNKDALKNINIKNYLEKFRNTGKLIANNHVLNYLDKLKRKNEMDLKILAFKPNPRFFKVCKENNFKILLPDADIARELEDKVIFYEIFTKYKKISLLPYKIGILENFKFENVFKKFENFVVQKRRGYAGNSTYFIKNKKDFEKLQNEFPDDEVKITKFITGPTLTLNACATKQGIFVSKPFLQITGEKLLSRQKGGTCGVSFDIDQICDEKILTEIENQTKLIGKIMYEKEFRGIFGLDLILTDEQEDSCLRRNDNGVYVIECNPRMTISVPHFTKRELASRQKPLLMEHLEEFEGKNEKWKMKNGKCKEEDSCFPRNDIKGASLILRNKSSKEIILKKTFPAKWHKYNLKTQKIVETDKGFEFENLPKIDKNELLFFTMFQEKGYIVHPDMEYAEIYFVENILDKNFKIKKEVLDLIKKCK
ncbi:MAG: Biotin carboxylase-like protein [Candidatus Peregrinibacteria bacterium GW2011_GWF2_33_10]|nr:MAG: Biotin carboxylase-like protein [Candidatus Peregrinibacteria bacterium GW2011_GWF2_33_10]OGJ45106.1 MAG: hypothetical protein A2272_06025 [Candidatus Peregrinibacteria bacterium RIFOXYA12_FULL_33_12]OGJ50086.1 MAG: hypothetical protein A2307_01820 [Candidatus Peregrinibacteria bacterium RIFOXYB2_FULL_33_20]